MVIVVMMIVVIRLGNKLLRRHFAAMAGAALHRYARVLHHADVILVDVLGHLHHQPGGGLFLLRVIGEIEPRLSIGPDFGGVGGMAG